MSDMDQIVLVFDFFGVICSEVAPFWLARHFSATQADEIKSTIVRAADTGEISQNEMFDQLSQLTNVPPAEIERQWLTYAKIDAGVVAFVRQARNRYSLALLTNAPAPFVRGIVADHKLSDLFEVIIVSSEIRYAKPSWEAFEAVLSALNIRAEQAVMIDDNPINIASAIEGGMSGIVFESLNQLRIMLPLGP